MRGILKDTMHVSMHLLWQLSKPPGYCSLSTVIVRIHANGAKADARGLSVGGHLCHQRSVGDK